MKKAIEQLEAELEKDRLAYKAAKAEAEKQLAALQQNTEVPDSFDEESLERLAKRKYAIANLEARLQTLDELWVARVEKHEAALEPLQKELRRDKARKRHLYTYLLYLKPDAVEKPDKGLEDSAKAVGLHKEFQAFNRAWNKALDLRSKLMAKL